MVRGNNGEKVLNEEIHKDRYLDILTLYKEKIGFIIYAYCIMDNHADNYLLQLIRYIHNNPVKANLEGGVEYEWSSHVYYTVKKKNNIVDTSYVLRIFSENINKAIKQYLKFMNQDDTEIIYVNIDELQSKNLASESENKELIKNTNIYEIIEKVCVNENVTIDEITKKIRTQKISDIRKAIVLLSEKHCNVSNKLLSQKLNLSSLMISKIRSGDSKGTDYVEEVIRRWKEKSK